MGAARRLKAMCAFHHVLTGRFLKKRKNDYRSTSKTVKQFPSCCSAREVTNSINQEGWEVRKEMGSQEGMRGQIKEGVGR
jgi:hypothetical protein